MVDRTMILLRVLILCVPLITLSRAAPGQISSSRPLFTDGSGGSESTMATTQTFKSPRNDSLPLVIAAAVVFPILILLIIVAVILWRRRRRGNRASVTATAQESIYQDPADALQISHSNLANECDDDEIYAVPFILSSNQSAAYKKPDRRGSRQSRDYEEVRMSAKRGSETLYETID